MLPPAQRSGGCLAQLLSLIIPMAITYESIMDAAQEFETVLNQREAEMDQDPSQEISHEEFLAHFSARRQA